MCPIKSTWQPAPDFSGCTKSKARCMQRLLTRLPVLASAPVTPAATATAHTRLLPGLAAAAPLLRLRHSSNSALASAQTASKHAHHLHDSACTCSYRRAITRFFSSTTTTMAPAVSEDRVLKEEELRLERHVLCVSITCCCCSCHTDSRSFGFFAYLQSHAVSRALIARLCDRWESLMLMWPNSATTSVSRRISRSSTSKAKSRSSKFTTINARQSARLLIAC